MTVREIYIILFGTQTGMLFASSVHSGFFFLLSFQSGALTTADFLYDLAWPFWTVFCVKICSHMSFNNRSNY